MAPEFHTSYEWQTDTTWIADGTQRIARIQPPKLLDLVLRPGGPTLASWLTLFWWQYTDNEQPGRSAWLVDELRLDDSDPLCYRLFLRSHNAGRSVESRCQLLLTYDATRDSYVYAVETDFAVQPGKTWVIEPQGGVEFVDPWFKEAVGPAVPYQGARPQRWPYVLYTNPEGEIIQVALNHLGGPHTWQIFFPATGGWLGLFNHEAGNPVIELDADTAQATRAEVCAWGYDMHFIRRVLPDAVWEPDYRRMTIPESRGILLGGQHYRAGYRLYSEPASHGAALLARARKPQLPAEVSETLSRPAYRAGCNTFQAGLWPQAADSSWYWSPSHPDGLVWDHQRGHGDSDSLGISNPATRLAHWEVPQGRDFWMEPLPTRQQRLSGWIRTEKVVGAGAYLSYRYSNYEIEMGRRSRFPEYRSAPLTGTHDWTYFAVNAEPPPPGITRAYVRLVLDGTGDAWFDDVALGPV